MSIKFASLISAVFLALGVFTAARSDSRSKMNQTEKIRTVVNPVKDIWSGSLIDTNLIEERTVSSTERMRIPSDHISSRAEVVGKVARKDLCCGTIICRHHLTLPTPPKRGEDWLLYYSEPQLSKSVGKRVALKGFLTNWIIGGTHKDYECAILSCDQLTYVRVGFPCNLSNSSVSESIQRAASARRASWMANHHIVIARGVLHHCQNKLTSTSGPRNYYLLDQRTLTITKSSWCK